MDQADDPQASAFVLLSDPATYGGCDVGRIDTHANVVFLAGDRALKVKRAVHLPFLDYSTLEKRKAACAAELAVNRMFAPQLYRRIVPITRDLSGRLTLDGEGEIVEWAVEMHRFDENKTLDRIVDVSGVMIRSHTNSLPWSSPCTNGRPPSMAIPGSPHSMPSWIRMRQLFEKHPIFSTPAWPANSTRPRVRNSPDCVLCCWNAGRRGLVRRGHGDLHLGNIALLDGRPVPFDAIEFDPNVAAGDVLYDLAFLLMDLLERGFVRAANIVFNGYFALHANIDDLDGLAALPLFLSLRATIRSKVTAARLQYAETRIGPLLPRRPELFPPRDRTAFAGPSDANRRGRIVGNRQVVTRTRIGTLRHARPRALSGPVRCRAKETVWRTGDRAAARRCLWSEVSERVYGIVAGRAAHVIAANHSVIVDAVFAKPEGGPRSPGSLQRRIPHFADCSWLPIFKRVSVAWGPAISTRPTLPRRLRFNRSHLRSAGSNGPRSMPRVRRR